jgi:ABC-type Fe3+/spermidine/putrescine transport system ATPase subunit
MTKRGSAGYMGMKENERPMLILKDIHKFYGKNEVLKGVSLEVRKGELVTFVGPSGCGKTTLLRIIGGFTDVSSGDIILDGQRINDLPPNLRDTRICFQNYALFPHMTVAENIGYGLKINRWSKNRIEARVNELLKIVELETFGDRMIDKLSGGQQQRVAFARALSLEPKVLLLDEPLSNLDANLRVVMREEIRNIQARIQVTTIFVTHDQYEAMCISDRLIVLHNGVIQQIGSPVEIYERPANEFIASFVGYVNFLEGRVDAVQAETRSLVVATELGRLELDHTRKDIATGDPVLLVIRPEAVSLSPWSGGESQNMFHGAVESQMYAGNLAKYTIKFGQKEMVIDQYNPMGSQKYSKNEKVKLTIPRNVHVLKRQASRAANGLGPTH